jgi:hypothetical protein
MVFDAHQSWDLEALVQFGLIDIALYFVVVLEVRRLFLRRLEKG